MEEYQIPVTSQVAVEQHKQSNFIVILLSVLLFISVSIAGFFVNQNRKLISELKVKNEGLNQTEVVETLPTMKPAGTFDDIESWTTVKNEEGFSFKYPPIEAASSIDFGFKNSNISFDCLSKSKSETRIINGQKLVLDYYIYSNKGICGSDDLNRFVINVPEYPPFIVYYKDLEKDLAISFLDTIISTFKFENK